MASVVREIGLIVLFILVGGVFAAAEIALVSLRDSQLAQLAARGKRGARVARLAADPNRFLSAVQVGVTMMGFLSAAFGGATIAARVAPVFTGLGLAGGVADTIALVLVTIAISYVSIVLGELAAKRLALQRAEGFALALAPLVDRIAHVLRPVIWLLSKSTDVVVRVLGGDPKAQREEMSDQELRELVSGHQALGDEERHIVTEVFRAVDRQVREVMVPRTEVDFLDARAPVQDAVAFARQRPRSRYPVIRGSADDVAGFVHVRDLFGRTAGRSRAKVGDLVREIVLLPWSAKVLPTLSLMRREGAHIAVVVDEYGGTAGVVTLEDLIEVLVGDIRDEYDEEEAHTTKLAGGELEVDGLLNLDDFADTTGVQIPDGPYETVAGYVVARLGHLPTEGESTELGRVRLTVAAVHGRRVSRVRVEAKDRPDTSSPTGVAPGSAPAPNEPPPTGVAPGSARVPDDPSPTGGGAARVPDGPSPTGGGAARVPDGLSPTGGASGAGAGVGTPPPTGHAAGSVPRSALDGESGDLSPVVDSDAAVDPGLPGPSVVESSPAVSSGPVDPGGRSGGQASSDGGVASAEPEVPGKDGASAEGGDGAGARDSAVTEERDGDG